MNVVDVSDRISELAGAFRGLGYSHEKIATTINDILVLNETPYNLISAAWEFFAKLNGVDARFMTEDQDLL